MRTRKWVFLCVCVKVTQKHLEKRVLKMLIFSVARSVRDMTEKWGKGDVLIFKMYKCNVLL